MNVLCIDTSTRSNWVALYANGEMIACAGYQDRQSCLINLIPTIELVLKNAQITPAQLECIAAVIGPGTWSSLRIGLATVKQLCLVNHVPLFTMNNLDLLAERALDFNNPHYILAAMDAQNHHVYAALYQIENNRPELITPYLWENTSQVVSRTSLDVNDLLIVGDGAVLFKPLQRPAWRTEILIPSADNRYLAFLARKAEIEKPTFDREAIILLKPLYIQPSSAEVEFKVRVT